MELGGEVVELLLERRKGIIQRGGLSEWTYSC